MNDDPKKLAEDQEYVAGYKTGRDGDFIARAVDMILDFARPDTTYGKGFQQGREDRHNYGSRQSRVSENADRATKKYHKKLDTNSHKVKTERKANSSGSYSRVEQEPIGYMLITIPFFSILAGWLVALVAGQVAGTVTGCGLAIYMLVKFFQIKELRESAFECLVLLCGFLAVGFIISKIFD
jgi:hypothetical protein